MSAEVMSGGFGVFLDVRLVLFPYLCLFLLVDHLISRHGLTDSHVFALGAGLSVLYFGLYRKDMHDGFALLGVNWVALLGRPLEWGMIFVLWFHCLAALFPRGRHLYERRFRGWVLVAAIAAAAAATYAFKIHHGLYRGETLLGPFYIFVDTILAALALRFLWRLRRTWGAELRLKDSRWIWGWAGVILWMMGAQILAEMSGIWKATEGFFYFLQFGWVIGLVAAGGLAWRRRPKAQDEEVSASRPMLAAGGLRILGSVLLVLLVGPTDRFPEMNILAGLLCDLPSKALFFYAFFTTRLEV